MFPFDFVEVSLCQSVFFAIFSVILAWYDLNLVGSGISYVTKYFPSEFLWKGRALYQLHNEPLEVYAAAGLFGLVALGIVWVTSIKQSKPEINAVLIALLFNSLGNFPIHCVWGLLRY
jgi:hypothetical protein